MNDNFTNNSIFLTRKRPRERIHLWIWHTVLKREVCTKIPSRDSKQKQENNSPLQISDKKRDTHEQGIHNLCEWKPNLNSWTWRAAWHFTHLCYWTALTSQSKLISGVILPFTNWKLNNIWLKIQQQTSLQH